jgi:hypothetical protein
MRHRSHLNAKERAARARLKKTAGSFPLLRGSLVTMERACGKPNCRCAQGQKHSSLYLSIKIRGQRKMICVPRALEESIRSAVETSQEIDRLLREISQACLGRFLREKEEGKGKRGKPPSKRKKDNV